MSEDHIRLQRNQLFREHLKLICLTGRKASIDASIAILRPSELLETLPESRDARLHVQVVLGGTHQHADTAHSLGLLRADSGHAAAAPPRRLMNSRRFS
jgi:hypothetical protein